MFTYEDHMWLDEDMSVKVTCNTILIFILIFIKAVLLYLTSGLNRSCKDSMYPVILYVIYDTTARSPCHSPCYESMNHGKLWNGNYFETTILK